MNANEVLSPEMRVTPLKEGEVAKFRLLAAGMKEAGREEPALPEVYKLSDKEEVYDPFAKKTIMIANVVGVKNVMDGGNPKFDHQGAQVMVPRTERPEFIRGKLTCTHLDNGTYAFLMRSKKNETNSFAPKNIKKVFRLVDNKLDIEEASDIEELRYKAEKFIREAPWPDVLAVKEKLNKSPDKRLHIHSTDMTGIKLDLIRKTRTYYKAIIWASTDTRSKILVTILEGENFGFLNYHDDKWYLNAKGQYRQIHQVGPEQDKNESLIDYFDKKGDADYRQLADLLKAVFGAKKKAA